jgi:hypothetical protein
MQRTPSKNRRGAPRHHKQIEWLPFDSRLIPDIFAFGHVKGIARLFLEVEMILAVLVVIGTLILTVIRLFS